MSTPRPQRTGVLFVCLGNICRSPLAEGVFLALARERGLEDRFDVDSCGIGAWHVGNPADPRSLAVALRHGIRLDHAARQLEPADFDRFHHLIAMDRSNRRALLRTAADHAKEPSRVRLMGAFDPGCTPCADPGDDVPDPYHGDHDDFERVYQMLTRTCAGLLDHLA